MPGSILFASGDVGGSRALLPIAEVCKEKAYPFAVLDHGSITEELPTHWKRVYWMKGNDSTAIKRCLREHGVDVLVFASSLKDNVALCFARQAQELEIPVVHVLDNWSNYRLRMEIDGYQALIPDVYTVMDELAYEDAIRDGVKPSILAKVGQPALANLRYEYAEWNKASRIDKCLDLRLNPAKTLIAFVSEPVELDQGGSSVSPLYRGYTEQIVLRMFCEGLQSIASEIEIGIIAHPREDPTRLASCWHRHKGELTGRVLKVERGREGIFLANAVAGMASILLYDAWLIGKPVASLQPGLLTDSLRMLSNREDVCFVDSYEHFHSLLMQWLQAIHYRNIFNPRSEIEMHEQAPMKVFGIVSKLAQSGSIRKKQISGVA
jgi:hypothetical protein